MKRGRRSETGFTLIEIVLVIVVTAIALPTLLLVLGEQARYTVDVEKSVVATALGQELMETIESAGFAAASGYDGYSDNVTLGTVDYARAAAVCDVNASDLDTCVAGPTDYRRIQVTVTSDRSVSSLVTVLSNI